MNLLLDTHIWLWFLQERKRIGRHTLNELCNSANELWLSPISTWEALTLEQKGRIRIHGDLAKWLERATDGMREAAFTHEIALVSRTLTLHGDPADRLLVATAQVLDLTLVTADQRLLGIGGVRTLANR